MISKLFGILDTKTAVPETANPVTLVEPVCGEIAFRGVTFGYDPDTPVLEEIDLVIGCGERVAVVGETGGGKSTLAKLAVRFYDPRQGSVSIDGVDLRELSFASLRRHVALVPQEGYLFGGTLRDNLAFARPEIADEAIWEVCAAMGIEIWVRSLPERLDTEVRERGSRFSSGERQLVALARALIADPALIVLDEATSNLDPETEARVEAALSVLLEGRTAMVIAHRLQTARRADRVVLVDGGRIIEEGTHDDLIVQGGAYARLSEVWEGSDAAS